MPNILQITPCTGHFGALTGCDFHAEFTVSSSRITGPTNEERGGGAGADDVGVAHRCRVGNYKS